MKRLWAASIATWLLAPMLSSCLTSTETHDVKHSEERGDSDGLCPMKTNTIQLFDPNSSALNTTNFNSMMEFAKTNYGPDRAVVFASADAEAGQGKSLLLSMLMKCPSQFKAECKGELGGVTKGVWTHDKPLTCCALSWIHGIADTSKCSCQCHHDARDLDAASNTCPLIYLVDVEGSRDKDMQSALSQSSLSPIYMLSQVHLRVIRTERVTPVMATYSSLVLVNKLESLVRSLGNSTGGADIGSNHELHFLNMASTDDEIVAMLRACGSTGECGVQDEENRDMVLNFYERSGRIVDIRFDPTFDPEHKAAELLKTARGKCRSSAEQAVNLVTLFKHHLSSNFTEQFSAYVRDELASVAGLRLPLLTGSTDPISLATVHRVLPVLVDATVQKEQGCPIGSLHCAIHAAKCLTILADNGIAELINGQWTTKASAISHSANSIEVLASSFGARSDLLNMVRLSGLLPAQCFRASNQTKLIPIAEPAMNALVTNYEAQISAFADKKSYHLKEAATAIVRSDQASGIFSEINGQNAVRNSLANLNEVFKDEVGNDILITGLHLPIDSTVAAGRSTPLGTNFYLKAHKLVVPPGNWVLYAPERSVFIEASEIELQGTLTIDVSGLNGPTVSHPVASNGASPGEAGQNGLPGSHGTNAGNIVINAIKITSTGSGKLTLTANGGRGSTGQQGGNGAVGKDGKPGNPNYGCDYHHPERGRGHRGKDGQHGGCGGDSAAAGHGGAGGNITVTSKVASEGVVGVSTAGGAGGNRTEGGKGAPGGEGGRGGTGSFKECDTVLIFRGTCDCYFGGNIGESGIAGRQGEDGKAGEAGNPGVQGQASVQTSAVSCEHLPVAGLLGSLQYMRILLLQNAWDTAAEMANSLLTLVEDCSSASSIEPIYVELILLLNKIDAKQNIYGRNANSVPALGPSAWLDAAKEIIDSLSDTAVAYQQYSDDKQNVHAAVKALGRSISSVQAAVAQQQALFQQEAVLMTKHDDALSSLDGALLAAQKHALAKLQDLDNAVAKAVETEQDKNKKSIFDQALAGLSKIAGVAGKVASLVNIATALPSTLINFAAKSQKWVDKLPDKLDVHFNLKAFSGDSSNIKGLLQAPRAIQKFAQDSEGKLLDSRERINGWIDKYDQRALSNGPATVNRGSTLVAVQASEFEDVIKARMQDLSQTVAGDVGTQAALREVMHAYGALLQVVAARTEIIHERDNTLASMQNLIFDAVHLQSILAGLNSGQLAARLKEKSATYVQWLNHQATAVLFEFVLVAMDNSARALTLAYARPVAISSTFFDSLLKHTVGSDVNKLALTINAMKSELAELKKQEKVCKEHDGRNPTALTNIQWQLPAWAVESMVSNAVNGSGEGLITEFPWDSPDVQLLTRLTVQKVRVVVELSNDLASAAADLHRKLQIELKHLGDCTTRISDKEFMFHVAPPRQWVKDVEVKGFAGKYEGKVSASGLGVDGEYALLSPFTHWHMKFVGLTPAIKNRLKLIKTITLQFDGVSY